MSLQTKSRWPLILAAVTLLTSTPVNAQSAGSGPVRTILAAGRVNSVVDTQRSFRLERVTIQPGASGSYAGGPGTIYVASGQATVSVGSENRVLHEGEGTYFSVGENALITARADAPVALLHFLLIPTAEINRLVWSGPVQIAELHRMALPAAVLKPGPYEFSMIHVTISAGAPSNPPHMRSTAALYYILADGKITIWPSRPDGTITGEPRTERRPAGSIQEEPFGFVHGWGSPPGSAARLLQANISQEGVREIIFIK
jgi:quercetin dioxygenase-like cupin family protein